MKRLIGLVLILGVLFAGCSQKEYYQSVNDRNKDYNKAYAEVDNDSIVFDGTFDGTMTITTGKELPKLQMAQKPKDAADYVMQAFGILAPVALGISGQKYNYETANSSNKYNAQSLGHWTDNFKSETSLINNESNSELRETINISDFSNIENTQGGTPNVRVESGDDVITVGD